MPPLWLVALIVAAAAPFCVAALQAVLEARLRGRTKATLGRAFSALDATDSRKVRRKTEERSGEGPDGERRRGAPEP